MSIIQKIRSEIEDYITNSVDISEGHKFNQYKLVKRISLYQNQVYPKGKVDIQGNYKFWYDITGPRVNSEVKNIDFDTKNISYYSDIDEDYLGILLLNCGLKDWLDKTGQANRINEFIEYTSSWGNCVWKKVKGDYEKFDLRNLYVLNQTAETLEDSDVIERHEMTQSDMREKIGIWKNVEEAIKTCGNKTFKPTERSTDSQATSPMYEVYERNGYVSTKELMEAQKKKGGKDDQYVLAKIIVCGMGSSGTGSQILYAEEINKKPYKEAHRSTYKGRWFREGLTELLFDCQTRANEIGNQIARGLEWASRTIFRTTDSLFVQNMLTDLKSGDVIKSKDLVQVETRMQGLDQLIADWNRNIEVANQIANSYEVVQGAESNSGTPFRLGALQNQNANKLFGFIRQKIGESFADLIEEWIMPDMIREMNGKKIIELTGDSSYLDKFLEVKANAWYVNNLLSLPPHSSEEATAWKQEKIKQWKQDNKSLVENDNELFKGMKPRVRVDITGEGLNVITELETLANFIQLEQDPIRRSALIELAMKKSGVDVSKLPKTQPIQQQNANQGNTQFGGGQGVKPNPAQALQQA